MRFSDFSRLQPFNPFDNAMTSRFLGRSERQGSGFEGAFAADQRVDDIRARVMHQNGMDANPAVPMSPWDNFFGGWFGGGMGGSQPGSPWDVDQNLIGLGDALSRVGDQARWGGRPDISQVLEQLAGVAFGQASSADRVDAGLSERDLSSLATKTARLLASGLLPPPVKDMVEQALGVLQDRIASGPPMRTFNPWGWFGG